MDNSSEIFFYMKFPLFSFLLCKISKAKESKLSDESSRNSYSRTGVSRRIGIV
jgi:hypothetical protein